MDFDEDRSQACTASGPSVMASLRTTLPEPWNTITRRTISMTCTLWDDCQPGTRSLMVIRTGKSLRVVRS